MNFSELEKLMYSLGVTTLAEIARTLNTTPQAVSNWKARNQVPHHIALKLSQLPLTGNPQTSDSPPIYSSPITHHSSPFYEEDTISLSDILLTMAEQLKVIVLTTFISVFLTFTYVQFIQAPQYVSWATVLLPSGSGGNLGGLAGLASQFGVNVPTGASTDLSSPTLIPELLRSRTFAEKILEKEFYSKKYNKVLPLLEIFTFGEGVPEIGRDTLVTMAWGNLGNMIEFDQDPNSTFSVIKVTASDPVFAKELAEVVLVELESLNRFFKSKAVKDKIKFIEQRIASVAKELESSEQNLKAFNEQNRQVSAPSLVLVHERLTRDLEIQKGIYLTLKQQLELAKIEEVQETSVLQLLDIPQIALAPSNKNLIISVVLSFFIGGGLGILLGFIRSYLGGNDMNERKKIRRIKHFIKKKTKDIILDKRVSGIVSILMLVGLPFYLEYESKNPVYFGRYSFGLMILISIYILTMITFIGLYIYNLMKK